MKPLPLVLMDLDVLQAWAEQVTKVCAQLAALAGFPADAHSSFLIFFNVEMTLIVAILADRDALETCSGTLVMDLTAKRFFGCSAWCICSVNAEIGGVFDATIDLISGSRSELVVVEFVLMWARAEIGMRVEVVWVQTVSHCGSLLVIWGRAECEGSWLEVREA